MRPESQGWAQAFYIHGQGGATPGESSEGLALSFSWNCLQEEGGPKLPG